MSGTSYTPNGFVVANLRMIALNYGLLLGAAGMDGDDLTEGLKHARMLREMADEFEKIVGASADRSATTQGPDDVAALRPFALLGARVLRDMRDAGNLDVCGGDIQEWASASGVLRIEKRTVPCGPCCICAEFYEDADVAECYVANDSAMFDYLADECEALRKARAQADA